MQAPSRVLPDFAEVFSFGYCRQHRANLFDVSRRQSTPVVISPESLQSLVTETDDPHGPVYGLTIHMSMRTSSHSLRPAADGDDAGARDFDQAERQHQVDEALDLVGRAGDFEHEALVGRIDDA